jgi:predicted nucleotidyltransferase
MRRCIAMVGLKEEDLQIAENIAFKIKDLLGTSLRKIILFGSRARGDGNADSDFEFLVIANFEEHSWPRRAAE